MRHQVLGGTDLPVGLRVCPDGERTTVVLSGPRQDFAACSDGGCRREAWAGLRMDAGPGSLVTVETEVRW